MHSEKKKGVLQRKLKGFFRIFKGINRDHFVIGNTLGSVKLILGFHQSNK